jgi:hypothetical protein
MRPSKHFYSACNVICELANARKAEENGGTEENIVYIYIYIYTHTHIT